MADTEQEADSPRKGRSNAIMTYEEIANIHLAIQKVDLGVQRVAEKVEDVGKQHVDHEIRIRALELVAARSESAKGIAQWLYSAIWPAAAFGIALLGVFK